MKPYHVFKDGEYKIWIPGFGKEIKAENPRPMVWPARLSTGLLGLIECESGNRGPKGYSEVLLAIGNDGLRKFVDLGFLTCPRCLPENVNGFWNVIKQQVRKKYALTSIGDFTNKSILQFDARRVRWEEIMPVIGEAPNRFYVPRDLCKEDLLDFKKRFDRLGLNLPLVGYFNPDVPEIFFTEYDI